MGVIERKEREKEQRRQQILSAGEKMFLKYGVSNTTIDNIAKECEISRGTVYLYFKYKEEIFQTIVLQSLESLLKLMKDGIKSAETIDKKMIAIGDAYLKYYRENPSHFKLMNLLDEHTEDELKTGDLAMSVIEKSDELMMLIVDVIKLGVERGYFKPDINSYEFAIMLWSSSNGIIQMFDHLETFHSSPEKDLYWEKSQALNLNQFGNLNLEAMLSKLWGLILNSIRK